MPILEQTSLEKFVFRLYTSLQVSPSFVRTTSISYELKITVGGCMMNSDTKFAGKVCASFVFDFERQFNLTASPLPALWIKNPL